MGGVLAFFALSSYAAVASGLRQETEGLYGISISDVSVEAAQAMADAKVTMKVQNLSSSSVVLEDVASDVSEGGELFYKDRFGTNPASAGFTLLQNETLDLSSSHLGLRLTGLKQNLVAGDHLMLELRFRSGSVTVQAHVE
ncbi:hypothetical protein A3728_01130 [Sulfitobacter sp. HI0040]|nr:hypothetical protein A3728_01130 [Sulfitobacter sp. HI0040]KZZ65344.1 hypothetical protein A3764_00345 [Sulfitobacter sp. HI0129]